MDKETDKKSEWQPKTEHMLTSTYAQPLVSDLLREKKPQSVTACIGRRKCMGMGKNDGLLGELRTIPNKSCANFGPSVCRQDAMT